MGRIEEIKERMSKATEGEWGISGPEEILRKTVVGLDGPIADCFNENDTDFIAHSKSDITYLLGIVESLAKQVMDYAHIRSKEYDKAKQLLNQIGG